MKKVNKKFGTKESLYRVLLLVFFGVMLLGQFGRVEIVGNVSLYLHEIVLMWLLLIWLVDDKRLKANKKMGSLYMAGVWFLGVALLSLLVNMNVLAGGFYLLRLAVYAFIWPMLADLRKREILDWPIGKILILLGGSLAAAGLIQYLLVPDTTSLVLYGWDDHLYRAIGTLFDPNFLGLMIVLTLVLLVTRIKIDWRLVGLMLVTLGFTYSRSSFVALAMAMLAMGGLRGLGGVRRIGWWIGLILIGIILLPNRGGAGNDLWRKFSIEQRLLSNQRALEVWKQKPILGVGFNAYGQYLNNPKKYAYLPIRVSGPDNSFLLILATTGIVGALVFGRFVVLVVKQHKNNQWLMVSLVVVATHSLFNNSLFYPYAMVWIFSLLAEINVIENT